VREGLSWEYSRTKLIGFYDRLLGQAEPTTAAPAVVVA